MDIISHDLGPEIHVDGKIENGNIIISITRTSPSGSESFTVSENLKYFIDKEKDSLPDWAKKLVNVVEAVIP